MPANQPEPPNASANPIAQYPIAAIEKLASTFGTIVPAFFMRENPISSSMKPGCMNITKTPATMTQVVSTAGITSWFSV